MNNEISELETSSRSKTDSSRRVDLTDTELKTSVEKYPDLNITIFKEEPHCHHIKKSTEDSTHKVRQISAFYIAGVLVMSMLILGVEFGLGWWCGRFNPDMSPYKLNTAPFRS